MPLYRDAFGLTWWRRVEHLPPLAHVVIVLPAEPPPPPPVIGDPHPLKEQD